MNNATMNIHVQVSVWTYVFISLGYMLRSRIAGLCGNSVFSHSRNPRLFPKWLHHFTFPPSVYEVSHFSTKTNHSHLKPLPLENQSPTTCCLFHFIHPSGCEVVSDCGFNLNFSNN